MFCNFSRIYAYDFNFRRKSKTYETIPEPHKALSSNKRSQTTLGRVIEICQLKYFFIFGKNLTILKS